MSWHWYIAYAIAAVLGFFIVHNWMRKKKLEPHVTSIDTVDADISIITKADTEYRVH